MNTLKVMLLVLLAVNLSVHAQDRVERSHMTKEMAMRLAYSEQVHDRIVIKFSDRSGMRVHEGKLKATGQFSPFHRRQLWQLNKWLNQRAYAAQSLFSIEPEILDNLRQKSMALSGQQQADMNTFVGLKIPARAGVWFKDDLAYLNGFDWVTVAYLEAPVSLGLDFDPPIDDIAPLGITPLLVNYQQYFNSAPTGVGIFDAWSQPGGKGQGIKVIVYDNSYRATHEDLPDLFYTSGSNPLDEPHGTAVLGILGAKHNGIGMKGGVYEAEIGFQKAANFNGSQANNLVNAATQLDYGDVLVTEVGRKVSSLGFDCPCNPTQANNVPIEFYPAEYEAIQTIVSLGISVVETAGNGCVDFDDPVLQGMFDPEINDSGAIIAGASLYDSRTPTCYTNSGARVNLHAWGESVATLLFLRNGEIPLFDQGLDRRYGPNFGGTSSAAPIVATCVASVQGQFNSAGLEPLSPAEVRNLLINTGQPQTGQLNRLIGPMPDVGHIMYNNY